MNPVLATAAALALGLWLGWKQRREPWPERLAAALLPALLGTILFVCLTTAELCTRWGWSACRLAPAIGMFHGYPLYSSADSGVINGWLYGPIPALAWSPAALATNPLAALWIAAVINLLFLLVPLLAVCGRAAAGSRPFNAGAWIPFVGGTAALLQIYATWYMASVLNADACAVGLGAASCILLMDEKSPGGKRLAAAALLSVLAVWSKQTEAPLVLAQLAWIALQHGRSPARRFGLWYGGLMLATGLLVLVSFGARSVFFNMWTIPASHPFLGGWRGIWQEAVAFLGYTGPVWIVCIAAWCVLPLHGTGNRWVRCARSYPWLILILAGFAVLPTGLMASLILGGDRNSIHSVYYLVAAATAALAQIATAPTRLPAAWVRNLALALVVATTVQAVRSVGLYPALFMLPPRCLTIEACEFSRQYPGRVYFPWDPLATLLAEGKYYHFEYGIVERINAGRPPSRAQIMASLPPKIDWVLYPYADGRRVMVEQYLTEFVFTRSQADWLIYKRPASP